jgi:hypothetical protein
MYTPKPGEEGFGLLKAALREYLVADLSAAGLPSVIAELPNGAQSIIDEGFLTAETPTPVVMFTTVGDGQTDNVAAHSLVRFIVYVVDKGRGLSKVERILHRIRRRLNRTELALNHLTFPPGVEPIVVHIEASGSTSTASLPAWKAEARGLYLFLTVYGLEADHKL